MSEYDHTLNPVSPTGHEWPCPGFYRTSSVKDRTERCTCVTPTTEQVRLATGFKHSIQAERFDRWLAEVERAAAEKALTDAADDLERANASPNLIELESRYAGFYSGIRTTTASNVEKLRARAAALGLTAEQEGDQDE